MKTTKVKRYKKKLNGKTVRVRSHNRKLTKKQKVELSQQIKQYMKENKDVPSYEEFINKIGPFPKHLIKWADFLQNEGYTPKRRGPLSDEEITIAIKKAKRMLGKVPSLFEYRKLDLPQFELEDRKWNDLLKKAGFDIYEHPKDGDHPNWKDKNVKYRALHEYIIRKKPKGPRCEICGKLATRMELSNKDHQYSRNPNDYRWLCDDCHAKYDKNIARKKFKSRMKVIS